MQTKTVGVVIPIYNVEKYLKECLDSVINQSFFLDSDDYWELNCIEECVPRMDGVEVVWFNAKRYYDNIDIPLKIPNTLFENYGFSFECSLSRRLWIEKSLELSIKSFWFSVMGMIDFNFLKSIRLKFLDSIIHEDNLFGVLLFFQLNNLFILPNKMYIHRMRPNSIMNHDKKITKSNITQYMFDLHGEINCDAKEMKLYLKTYSWCMIAIRLIEFLEEFITSEKEKRLLMGIIKEYYKASVNSKSYTSKDPREIGFCLNQIAFYLGYTTTHNNQILLGAPDRIKNQLCYKLGNQIVKSTSLTSMFLLPYKLLSITINHKIEKKILKIMSKKDPKYKLPGLNSYTDHMIALEIKNHLSYKIGQVFIRDCKTWYKGGIIKLPFSIHKTYKDYKRKKKVKIS